MARETKVGLIVGLGVILFVGVFVSDYLSVHQDDLEAQDLANFHDQTTNQPHMVVTRQGETPDPLANDPAHLAAIALEEFERSQGHPVERREAYEELQPPHRTGPGVGLRTDDLTPIAHTPYVPPSNPIGVLPIDDPRLAAGHQIEPERLGPGETGIEHLTRVDIPEHRPISVQTQHVEHTVASGETLTAIARKHYDGDGNMWRSIRDANPGKVGPNGEVLEGAKLVIPKRSAEAADPIGELAEHPGGEQRPPRQRVRLITVQEGQTLSAIAAEHLGSARKWPQIMAVNSDVLDKPEQLRAGMKLRIPAEEEAEVIERTTEALAGAEEERTEERNTAEENTPANTYTVKAGDSLYRIAVAQLGDGERYKEIYEANRDTLSSANDIRVGMKLTIPGR